MRTKMKLCPKLVAHGIFDKDEGYDELKRAKLCLTCPLEVCIYWKSGAVSGDDIKALLKKED